MLIHRSVRKIDTEETYEAALENQENKLHISRGRAEDLMVGPSEQTSLVEVTPCYFFNSLFMISSSTNCISILHINFTYMWSALLQSKPYIYIQLIGVLLVAFLSLV